MAEAWKAETAYGVGDQITDSNGNTQECVTAGTSGKMMIPPMWETELNARTNDGTAVWMLSALAPPQPSPMPFPVPPPPMPPVPSPDAARWSRLQVSNFHTAVTKFLVSDLTAHTAAISQADAVMVNPASTDSQVNAAAEAIQKSIADMNAMTAAATTQLAAVITAMPPKPAPAFMVKER